MNEKMISLLSLINESLNNREKALFILCSTFLLIVLIISPDVRSSFFNVIKIFFDPKLMCLWIITISYVSTVCYILFLFNIVDISNIKEIIFWSMGALFLLLKNPKDMQQSIKSSIKENLSISAIIILISNFYSFSLLWELVTIPILGCIELVTFVIKDKYKINDTSPSKILIIYGIIVLVYNIYLLFNSPIPLNNIFNLKNILSFFLPMILTISYIPFLYTFSLFRLYKKSLSR